METVTLEIFSDYVAENSGHHIQLDEPQVVIDAVRLIVETTRQHKALDGKKR